MSRTPIETQSALELLNGGATRGMAISKLESQGLSKHLAEESVENAAAIYNRNAKFKSVFVAMGGLVLTVIAGMWLYHRMMNGRRGYILPITILGTGIMVLMYGAYGTIRNRI